MTLKTNQEKAIEDTHKKIKKRVKKTKKRMRKNATLTPQVARNTKADASKYAPYPQFAYRPADSPAHILKSKNDLVKLINTDIHNEMIRTLELETDISKLQHQRDIALKRKQELETTKRQKLQEKLQAEHDAAVQKHSYDQYKKDELHKHQRALLEMKIEADKAMFDQDLANRRELIDIETQQKRDKLAKERALSIRQAQLRGEENKRQHQHNNFKEAIEKFQWEGMYYDPYVENPRELKKKDNIKQGAQQLINAGIDFRYGERELIQQRRQIEMQKLIREAQRKQDDYREELSKYKTLSDASKDPVMKQLEDELNKAKAAYEEMQLIRAKDKESDKLRKEIHDIEHKTALMKAEDQAVDAKLIKQRDDLLRQLQTLEVQKTQQQKNARLENENRKMQRDIAVLQAQMGPLDAKLARGNTELAQQLAIKRWDMRHLVDNVGMERKIAELDAVQGHVSYLNQMRAAETSQRYAPPPPRQTEILEPWPSVSVEEDSGEDQPQYEDEGPIPYNWEFH